MNRDPLTLTIASLLNKPSPKVTWLLHAGPIAKRLNIESQQDNREPALPNKRAGRNHGDEA